MTELLPLYDKVLNCFMCQQKITTKKLRTRFIKAVHFDTDFCPVYHSEELNPLLYHIAVCPNCGFSFSEDFSSFFAPTTKEMITEKVWKQWIKHDFGGPRTIQQAMESYKLAFYCGVLKKEKHIAIAGILIRLAWLYRYIKDEEQEQRFMKLALKEYIKSYSEDDFRGTQVSEIKLFYIIGELSRRVGNRAQAVQFLSKVIEKQNQSLEKNIVEMAKEQWHLIRNSGELEESP